jgi:hypothetical protein
LLGSSPGCFSVGSPWEEVEYRTAIMAGISIGKVNSRPRVLSTSAGGQEDPSEKKFLFIYFLIPPGLQEALACFARKLRHQLGRIAFLPRIPLGREVLSSITIRKQMLIFPVFHLDFMAFPLLSKNIRKGKREMALTDKSLQVISDSPSQQMHQ